MCEPVPYPVIGKFAVVDSDSADTAGTSKKPVLIIKKVVIIEDEIAALVADTGAVFVRNRCAGKREIVDRDITVCDKNGLAVRYRHGRYHVDHAAD